MNAGSSVTPAPESRDHFTAGARSTVLYHGTGAIVTTAFFESGGYRYPLEELSGLERVEHGGWFQGRRYELWAWYRDQQVRLFQCFQAQEFGQVCRALTRAREHAGLA